MYLAIVADVHPITHPPNTTRTVWNMCLESTMATTGRRIAHAAAHPMVYPV